MKKPNTAPLPPPCVTDRMAHLLELTGTPATSAQQRAGGWLIVHTNGRVRATCSYTPNSRGKWAYASTLTVDGEQRPIASNIETYARLFADPDLKHPERAPVGALPPPLPLAPDEPVPPLLAEMATQLSLVHGVTVGHARRTRRLSNDGGHCVQIETAVDAHPDPDMYLVQADCPNGARVQMYLKARRPGSTRIALDFVCAVDAHGDDLMSEYGDDFEAAMRGILGVTMSSFKEAAPPLVRAADTRGHRANAVEARRASVIRN